MFTVIAGVGTILSLFDAAAAHRLQGNWIVISAVGNGIALDKGLVNTKWSFTDGTNRISSKEDGKVLEEGKYYFPMHMPSCINLLNRSRGDFAGIYRFDGDKLELCYAVKLGQGRPREFTANRGGGTVFLVLKRVP